MGFAGILQVFSHKMPVKGAKSKKRVSLITYPAYPVTLSRSWIEINGIAWTGSGKIRRVDRRADGGVTWTPARLQELVLAKAHTRFRHLSELVDWRRRRDHEPRGRRERLRSADEGEVDRFERRG